MKIKSGVEVNGLKVEILLAVIIAREIYASLGVELVITEATGGKHGHGSFHYIGMAIDLRTRDFMDKGRQASDLLKKFLGEEYDVVLEKDHIHIEFNPK